MTFKNVDMKIIFYAFSSFLAISLVSSCSNSDPKEKPGSLNGSSVQVKSEIKPDEVFDGFAKLISGNTEKIPANVDPTYYDSFSKQLNQKLVEIGKSRLSPITTWNQTALKRNAKSDTTSVFYPFSGGDFLHVNSLYPNANHYVMMAQESVGSIPDLSKMDKVKTKEYIKAADFILRDIYAKSYFITMNMIKDTKSSPVNGMLPVLLWSVSKTGHTVTAVEELKVDDNGMKSYTPFKVGENTAKAVRITFGNPDKGILKTLTYYSCDISNSGIEKDKALAASLKGIPPSNCFVKSASYLMHYETFTTIRNTVLDKAIYLVQDDTGIPYKYFEKSKFKMELYGNYVKPVSDFSANLYQKDMVEAYKTKEFMGALPFSLGYHWQTKDQNQMIAIKK
jgi:hypothetical protein